MKLRIGTRKSRLAVVQAEIVQREIEKYFPELETELVFVSTEGDRNLNCSLTSFGGKGVFTKELEEALLQREIDLAVHSAKDMPMEFPAGLTLGAVLPREEAQDVLVTTNGVKAGELAAGSVIGTSSLRRELLIRRLNPQVQIKLVRGNVQTRLEKLTAGSYDGIVLAAAGLKRLGLTDMPGIFFEYLNKEEFIPAPGQGILGVESREGELTEVMAAIHCSETAAMLKAEREYLKILGGGCNAPCGAYCRIEGEELAMSVMYAKDGIHPVIKRGRVRLRSPEMTTGNFIAVQAKRLAEELACQVRLRPVSLVGAGPGDAGLFTRKGLSCVRQADVIVYDNLISTSILNEARLDAELIYAGKRLNHHHLTQDEINAVLVKEAQKGKYVVRLKGGDPFIFGRGGEEALFLKENGIPFEIVPGVSSSYSVPAYAGIPVTHRQMASSFHVITGHEGAHKSREVLDYAALAKEEGTLIFLMGLTNLRAIAEDLIQNGKGKDTPAAVIQNGTTAVQKKVVSTLEKIAEDAEKAGIGTPAITVIGKTVDLGEKLDWFGRGVLFGKRVLVTGSRYVAGEMEKVLQPYGAEIAAISLIESRLLKPEDIHRAFGEFRQYQWIVFTSSNGVELFFEFLRREGIDLRSLMHLKFAGIGRKTAETLKQYGFFCDFVPSSFSGEDLAREWIPTLGKKERVLLMRSRDGSLVLPQKLLQAEISFTDVPLYETWVDERRREELNRLIKEADYVTIASQSAVKAMEKLLEQKDEIRAKVISIGPFTTKAAREAGIPVWKTAAEYTAEGIAAAILADTADK